ncbi:MAG: hypothetical protein DHS20C21_12570 [Gemmatimonadota bacterium]|nr:MAG: hypothetical protein DHS20C21_12570 [Gemmatimonadota bacterium]
MRFDRRGTTTRGLASLTMAVFLAATLNLAILPVAAQAADAREDLEKAQDNFLIADFSTALTQVTSLIESGDLRGGVLRDALVLAARCEVGLAHRASAVDWFCEVLAVEPSWQPDKDLYTKDEVVVFDQARQSCPAADTGATSPEPGFSSRVSASDPWYKNKTYWAIGGGVILVGAILLLAGGGDDEPAPVPLTDFPPPPGG